MTSQELIKKAEEARLHSYSPYSGFKVGAALLCSDGTVYTGCNIENSSFTPTVCAERTAFFKAIYDGRRDFAAIAIVGGKDDANAPCPPCGVCRQVMGEFCAADFMVYFPDGVGGIVAEPLSALLPHSFQL